MCLYSVIPRFRTELHVNLTCVLRAVCASSCIFSLSLFPSLSLSLSLLLVLSVFVSESICTCVFLCTCVCVALGARILCSSAACQYLTFLVWGILCFMRTWSVIVCMLCVHWVVGYIYLSLSPSLLLLFCSIYFNGFFHCLESCLMNRDYIIHTTITCTSHLDGSLSMYILPVILQFSCTMQGGNQIEFKVTCSNEHLAMSLVWCFLCVWSLHVSCYLYSWVYLSIWLQGIRSCVRISMTQ